MAYLVSFIFGAAIGSFVQVVVSRLYVAPIIKSRSKCLSCGEALRVSDLIPIISYLWLKGKCRYCKSVYGVESLLVEIFYGTVFVILYGTIIASQIDITHKIGYGLYYTILFIVLGVIALYDKRHSFIPARFLLAFIGLTLAMFCYRYLGMTPDESKSLFLLSPVVAALPFLTLFIITRGRGVGFGDVILFFGVGAFFGIEQSMAVLMISVWLGAIVGVILYILDKQYKTKTNHVAFVSKAIPFVPFIVIAFLIVLFTDIDIFSIANLLSRWYY